MNKINSEIFIVLPVYEDKEALLILLKEFSLEFNFNVYVVIVDDGSINLPIDTSVFNDSGLLGAILKLKRNVGHQRAIAIGVTYCESIMVHGQYLVVMDSDGEDLPSSINELFLDIKSNNNIDAVVAIRNSRIESNIFKFFYKIYLFVFKLLTGKVINYGNFMILNNFSVKRLSTMPELAIHVAATLLASKLRINAIPIDRGPRYSGKSKMNFMSLILHGLKAVTIFAEDVLVRVGVACAAIALFTLIGASFVFVSKIVGFAIPGWTSIILMVFALVFLQTGTLTLITLFLVGISKAAFSALPNANSNLVDEILLSRNDKNE